MNGLLTDYAGRSTELGHAYFKRIRCTLQPILKEMREYTNQFGKGISKNEMVKFLLKAADLEMNNTVEIKGKMPISPQTARISTEDQAGRTWLVLNDTRMTMPETPPEDLTQHPFYSDVRTQADLYLNLRVVCPQGIPLPQCDITQIVLDALEKLK